MKRVNSGPDAWVTVLHVSMDNVILRQDVVCAKVDGLETFVKLVRFQFKPVSSFSPNRPDIFKIFLVYISISDPCTKNAFWTTAAYNPVLNSRCAEEGTTFR